MPDPAARLNTALEGRYAIERELGEGGMATVYLAKDLKHNRNVALKVLKPELAAVVGADRFLAEIETTANLQHPHILPLFDSGEADSFLFYVMPYVEGETLRDRIEREHQLPVDEAVRIATAVANALKAAHDKGVIHRDIKPANILLSGGEPLVADFGIALAVGAAGGGRLTETGLSVGTPYYMSPEQATGDQAVGPASDTYALACVLYETLVGEPPYLGNTAQAVLGKIIQGFPVSATAVRKQVPPNVDAAIRKALEKLPADRFTGAQDFARALADPSFRHGEFAGAAVASSAATWRSVPTLVALGLATVLALAFGWSVLSPPPPAAVARFPSPFLPGQEPTGGMEFTPDGSALVYRAPGPTGVQQLWVRRWDNLEASPVGNTEGSRVGRFQVSPDGLEVAFVEGFPGPVRVVALAGGPARTIAERGYAVNGWDAEGNVYFGDFGISRVPATGGEIVSITDRGDALYHSGFRLMRGDKVAVFQVWKTSQSGEDAEIWSVDLETLETEFVIAGSSPRYAPTGHLLFTTPAGTLMGAPIDASTGQLAGPAVPLIEGLAIDAVTGTTDYAVSETGRLVYMTGAGGFGGMEFVWVDREGSATLLDQDGEAFNLGIANFGWRLSPDGRQLAFQRTVDGNTDIWIKEMPDGAVSRLTFDPAAEWMPQWRPDGEVVTFRSERSGNAAEEIGHLWSKNADGTGEASLLFDAFNVVMGVWSPDQQWLVLRQAGRNATNEEAARDILLIRPGVDDEATPLVATGGFWEQGPAISRDGRWLAYSSNETGRHEVFVRPFPDVDAGKWQVSTEGGIRPVWAHNGRELFFANPETQELVSAEYEANEAVFRRVGLQVLFRIPDDYLMNLFGIADFYDVDLDDERFLMAGPSMAGEEDTRSTVLVENFFEELKRLVPN